MLDLESLTQGIQHNCHISDAQFAGNYTLCIFLLKMRGYYRWEKGIPLSHPLPRREIGDWLTTREEYWEDLQELPLSPLTLNNQSFDPFDSESINEILNPHGYVYSGGFGIFHKPYFFLGKLEKKEIRDDITHLISSEEYARDMVAPPAMLLGKTVYIRKESLRNVIWERIDEWRIKKNRDTPMARALACYDFEERKIEQIESILDEMTENELKVVLLHETGEARARIILGTQWEDLLHALPRSNAEFITRAVRDNLADCLTTLPALVETENTASLHFYFANFNGMRKELFPEALEAYQYWIESGSLSALDNVCKKGLQRWENIAKKILKLYQNHANNLANDIETLANETCPVRI
jgi:hypothetical protein